MYCKVCNKEIPAARLEVLPETTTCVGCSEVKPYRAIIGVSPRHKTIEVQIVSADDPAIDYDEERWNNA